MKTKYLGGVLAAATLLCGPAIAADKGYPLDDDITFIVPYSAGGGFDTIVRTLSPALEEAMGATVVPENLPGASGTRGGQAVYRADPDGYTIGIFNIPGLTVSEALGRDIGFNLGEITWIANIAEEKYAIAVKADSPIQSLKDLCDLGRPIKLSDTGKDSTSSITSVLAFDMIGCPISNITGYGGSNDTMIAVMRGEVDATLKPVSSLSKYTKSGDLRFIVTISDVTLVEGVPTTTELGYPELAKFGISRVVGAPPNMPAEIVEKLAAGFEATLKADSVREWAAGTSTTLRYMSPAETTAMMDELSQFYTGYKDLLAQ
ncbi:tripartite tricarboxylate transporter substrate binding protein [Actibacterium sp. MT2.3-13A]|uniref:Bug family tripartite tricarboxylate transporter substrate binding protein n=1 Tax=Actibacterium sp. MT2.3-13A TaxID=2828332 RepID=UPI001BAA5AB9|nr:tripartite tricarboxylate transporter substrate binding protein [Actibacterium sp. MT2.3-13A]